MTDNLDPEPISAGAQGLPTRQAWSCRVLVVDDDPMTAKLVSRYLVDDGYEVQTAENGVAAIQLLREEDFHIVLTDWLMPEMDGLELCRAIRSDESIGVSYIIVFTAQTEKSKLVEAFDASADDFLTKPVDRKELLARVRAGMRIVDLKENLARREREIHKRNAQMAILNNKLERLAITDELTGLFNRRHAMTKLDELWELATRYAHPLTCIMFDLDHFKRLNDTYGHAAGDAVLRSTASIALGASRGTDIVGRVGGEEFLVLCPNTDIAGAEILATRIRDVIAEGITVHDEHNLRITASLGVAMYHEGVSSPEELVKRADEALYQAKASGRNCVQLADPAASPVQSPER